MSAVGGVNFHVDRGEVVGLLGDNGAGKSTLIKMLAGAIEPTSGEILVRGKRETHWNAARSRDAGIETVFQDRALCVQQTITRNIFLGRELTNPLGFLNAGRERAEAERLMREIGFTSKVFSPNSIVGQLSGGERQGVALARAIYNKADLIVMDEPTTALSLTETEKVFRFVRAVRAGGRSVLFIGHNIHHVFDIAERFVVMDRGTVALHGDQGGDRLGRASDRLYGAPCASAGNRDSAFALLTRRSRPDERLARTDRGARPAGRAPARKRAQALCRPQSRAARHACRVRRDDRDVHGRQPFGVPALADLQFGSRDLAGRALPRRASGVRRHGRRDRSLVPGDHGIFGLDLRA